MGFTKEYMLPLGCLKLVEIFCLVVAFATVEDVRNSSEDYKILFHEVMCIIAFILAVLWFLINLCKRFTYGICMKVTVGLLHWIVGVLVIIGASILVDWYDEFYKHHTMKTGGAFGILAAIAIIIDGFLHLLIKDQLAKEVETGSTRGQQQQQA